MMQDAGPIGYSVRRLSATRPARMTGPAYFAGLATGFGIVSMSRPMPSGCIFSASAEGLGPQPEMNEQEISANANHAVRIDRREASNGDSPSVGWPMDLGYVPDGAGETPSGATLDLHENQAIRCYPYGTKNQETRGGNFK